MFTDIFDALLGQRVRAQIGDFLLAAHELRLLQNIEEIE